MNTVVPAIVAERFAASRIVVFSTGNVYAAAPSRRPAVRARPTRPRPWASMRSPASAASASSIISPHHGLRCLLFRLNYAVDLRYGVLVDIARKVFAGEPVDLTVPAFNVIWQRDANSYALRSLALLRHPAAHSQCHRRRSPCRCATAAEFFAARFARPCRFSGAGGRSPC